MNLRLQTVRVTRAQIASQLVLLLSLLLCPELVSAQRVNLAKFQDTTADASHSADIPARYATDGVVNNDARWYVLTGGPHWLQVRLPLAMSVGSAQVFLGWNDTNTVANFSIQYLNASSNWVTCPGANFTGNTLNERNIVFTTNVTAQVFRFYSTDAAVRVKEFALYPPNGPNGWPLGTDVQLNLAGFRGALADATYQSNFPRQAVDGYVDDTSRWLSPSTTNTHWLQVDFDTQNKIGSAHFYSGFGATQCVTNFELQFLSGTNWLTIPGTVFTNNTTNALVINFPTPVTTDSVRFYSTNGGFQRVRELLIFPANGGAGYLLGTDVKVAPRPTQSFTNYDDDFYSLVNRASGHSLVSDTNGSGEATAASTTDEKSFQVLYNYDSDTYRLRNRDSWNCLEVAGASTNDGAAIVEGDYSAAPHQLWKYQYANGTNMVFINVWSGKAMSSTAGVVTQQPLTAATNQQWSILDVDHFPKKGTGGHIIPNVTASSWGYNWGFGVTTNPDPTPEFVFTPMQWGNYYMTTLGRIYAQSIPLPDATHLMGFNEPDHYDQSGASLDDQETGAADFSQWRALTNALLLWPKLESMDVPLVSPAPASATGGWLAGFYDEVDASGMRSDYTAIHNYPGPNGGSASGLVSTINTAATSFGRKVWLTEFSTVDWSRVGGWSEEDNYNWINEFVWRAESLDVLKKYALFLFTASASSPTAANPWDKPVPAPRSNFFETNGTTLTAFGEAYAAWDQDATVRDDKVYLIHNKAARHRLRSIIGNSSLTNATIRSNGVAVQWVFRPAPGGRKYIVCAQDGRRLRFNGTTLDYAPVATTGTNVEWSVTSVDAYGWFYLDHPASAKRLQLLRQNNAANAPTNMIFSMAANTATTNLTNWRFVRPISPADISAPLPLANLQAAASNQLVSLTWNPSSAPDFWRYTAYRSTTNGGPYTVLATNLTATNLTDNAVTNGITYYYVVTATDLIGYESTNSNQAIATPASPLPTVPTNIVFAVTSSNLTLSWPLSYTGWLLQTQTNGLTATNWFTVPGSALTNSMTLPIIRSHTSVFFRLLRP